MTPPPESPMLSIVIPVYNERDTWRAVLEKVQAAGLPAIARQIILVEDGSTDGTRQGLREFAERLKSGGSPAATDVSIKVIFHERNRGKGAALRTGFAAADGDIVLVQDADLEYDPADYPALLEPILQGRADVVYGSRFMHGRPGHCMLRTYLANRFLTALSNRVTGLRLSDMETCYKAVRRSVLSQVDLQQNRFGIEPELTGKLAAQKARFAQVPISYSGRTKAQGKKIGWKDGLKAIWCILKYGRKNA